MTFQELFEFEKILNAFLGRGATPFRERRRRSLHCRVHVFLGSQRNTRQLLAVGRIDHIRAILNLRCAPAPSIISERLELLAHFSILRMGMNGMLFFCPLRYDDRPLRPDKISKVFLQAPSPAWPSLCKA